MSLRLHGKVAAVTGAASGIGRAIASQLAAAGARVVGLARRFPARPATPPGAAGVAEAHLDVTDEVAVRARFAELGDLDVLCCCAGVGVFGPIIDTRVEDLRAMLDTHVVGTFLCAREMLARRHDGARPGHIVVVSSVAALRTFADNGGYSAAKEGQRGLARVLTEEARALGIRVTTLHPGATDTAIWDRRPGFDRAAMLRCDHVAALVVEIVARPELAVEELLVMPPAGAL